MSYYKTRRGKRYRKRLQRFEVDFESHLLKLREHLINNSYRPKPYHRFLVYEPKKRQISAPVFIDRVVHRAIVSIIEPYYDKQFIPRSFACRIGKGTHFGMLQTAECFKEMAGKHSVFFVLKCDIKSYFASIDHKVLLDLLLKTIKCTRTIELLKVIINSYGDSLGKGIPIGNLTSQLFANVYLHELDIYVTQNLKEQKLFRYMDDFLILSPDKEYLLILRKVIGEFLETHLKLKLHPQKANVFRADRGLDFLGYFIRKDDITMRKRTLRRFKRRHKKRIKLLLALKKELKGGVKLEQLDLFGNAIPPPPAHPRHCEVSGPKQSTLSRHSGLDPESSSNHCERSEAISAHCHCEVLRPVAISNPDEAKQKLEEKIGALSQRIKRSAISLRGFLLYSESKRLKSGGVKVNGITIPKIYSHRKPKTK